MIEVERVRLAYNNVYLVSDGDALVVIDTGPDYRGAREALTAALRGRKPDLVVATHGHLDHAGLGRWWQAQGVPVMLGAEDIPQAEGHTDADIDLMEAYVRGIGAPEEVELEVISGLEQRRLWTHRMRSAEAWPEARDGRWPTGLRYETFTPELTVRPGVALPIRGLKAVPSPGHTPGNLVVGYWEDGNELTGDFVFSGDQLLPDITPTPAIQFHDGRRFPSFPRFLDSLWALDFRGPCYPGHGAPVDDGQVLRATLEQAQQRSERMYDELRTSGASTVYALSERMYPRALRRRFWQIVSTVQGHLDVLAEAEQVVESEGRWSV